MRLEQVIIRRPLAASLVATLAAIAAFPAAAQQWRPPLPKEALTAPALGYLNPASQALYNKAHQQWVAATKGIMAIMTAAEEQRFPRLSPETFTKTHAANVLLRAMGGHLEQAGEPAGIDFQHRSRIIGVIYSAAAGHYRSLPPGASFNEKVMREFEANGKRRLAAFQKAAELVSRGNFDAAEQLVEKTTTDWRLRTGLLPTATEEGLLRGFNPSIEAYMPETEKARRQTAAASLNELRQQKTPDVDALLQLTAAAAASVGNSGQAEINGMQYDGPDAFNQLSRQWKLSHWQLQQAEGIEMARCGVIGRNDSPELQQVRGAHEKLSSGMKTGLARLILADEGRATPELHARYMDAAADVVVNSQTDVARALDQALLEFAAKAELTGIGEWNVAVNDLLRWRRKAAAARGDRLRQQHTEATQGLLPATRSQGALHGLFPQRDGGAKFPELLGSAPEIVTLADAAGQKASGRYVIPAAPSATVRNSRPWGRVYLSVAPQWDVSAPLAALKADLLVTDELPPLTLAAAAAVQSAESGGFAACGGTVQQVIVKSWLQFKATLPAASWNMFPLGDLPQEDPPAFLPQAALNVVLQPEWLQHEFFVAPVAEPPQS